MVKINNNISEKVKGNAVSAYLMVFISWLFLLNKTNTNINNSFVKTHTKTAMLIHLWFLITYLIFISNSLFAWYSFLWFWINNIITDIIFLWLLILLIIWIYKAKNGETFNISKNLNISKTKNILDIDWNGKVTEKEKITILLSYVPFIGYINFAKYSENKTIQEWVRLNIIVSLIIILLFIFWHSNLATLFSLVYIVLITFIWINLFARDELISIKLPSILSPSNTYIWFIIVKDYLKNYFNSENFKWFNITYKKNIERFENNEKQNEENLKSKKELKLPKFLIYIPILNLIFLFFKNTKYSFHIINGIIITLLLIINTILGSIWYFNTNLNILLLFPILFWMWYINYKLAYKMPIIFDIYILFKNIFSIFEFSSKKLKEKRSEENEINLKVTK